MKLPDYERSRKEALLLYKNFEPIRCPALGGAEVYFSRAGFKHLVRKASIRPRREQIYRFSLLRHVIPVIANPDSSLSLRIALYQKDAPLYAAITGQTGAARVKVILCQARGSANWRFVSVMTT